MTKKSKLFLVILFLIINFTSYMITTLFLNYNVSIVLKNDMNTLVTHYKLLLETQKTTSIAIYETTKHFDKAIEVMSQAKSANQKERAYLRNEFAKIIQPFYKIIKKKGVLQYQFVFPDNKSFYRAHKPTRFGDDLTNVRTDFKYVNKTHKKARGFVQGRVAHGFRNTFPLFNKKHEYIGAMEVSFSSDSFQWYLNKVSNVHSHFLVNKNIFDAKTWQRDDMVLRYDQCAEAKEYMITLGGIHTKEQCIDNNRIKLKPIRDEINTKIHLGNQFSSHVKYKGDIYVLSFFPIKNLQNETTAWIVSYEKSPIITSTLTNNIIVLIVVFFLSLFIIYSIYKQIVSRQKIQKQKVDLEKQHKFLNDIINSTNNIMFITDFKSIKFYNNKFKDIFNENHCVLDVFLHQNGFLHKGLLQDDETFIDLVIKTPIKDRIVLIDDKNLEQIAFIISITKSENIGDYLVSLSDITKMKEYQLLTEKKVYIDKLTNVYNRNKFDAVFHDEIAYAKKYTSQLCIAMIDIDKFKNFNDKYGHLIGDEVLCSMAQTVNEHVRDTDIFARWGGEEFVILFKNISIERTKQITLKIKDMIQENTHPVAGQITASFGITQYIDGDTEESIFKRCDEALYLAKENGRNRVEVL